MRPSLYSGVMWFNIRFLPKFTKDNEVDLNKCGECKMPRINLTFRHGF